MLIHSVYRPYLFVSLIPRWGSFPFSKTFSGALEETQPVGCVKVVLHLSSSMTLIKALKLWLLVQTDVSLLSVVSTCVAAQTVCRFGPFYRSSYSPQSSGPRASCSRPPRRTRVAQWWWHTQAHQGGRVRRLVWPRWSGNYASNFFYVFVLVCRIWQQRWVVLWLSVIPTLSSAQLSNYASHRETWPRCRKAAGSTMR